MINFLQFFPFVSHVYVDFSTSFECFARLSNVCDFKRLCDVVLHWADLIKKRGGGLKIAEIAERSFTAISTEICLHYFFIVNSIAFIYIQGRSPTPRKITKNSHWLAKTDVDPHGKLYIITIRGIRTPPPRKSNLINLHGKYFGLYASDPYPKKTHPPPEKNSGSTHAPSPHRPKQ